MNVTGGLSAGHRDWEPLPFSGKEPGTAHRKGQPSSNFWVSFQISKITVHEQSGRLCLEPTPILHIHNFFHGFNIH